MARIKEVVRRALEEDEVDKALKDMERQEVRMAKLAKLKEFRLESEARVKELEKKLRGEEEGGGRLTIEDVEAAKLVASLPEDQRRQVLQILAILRRSGVRESPATLIPLAMAMSTGNPARDAEATAKLIEAVSKVSGGREDAGKLMTGMAAVMAALRQWVPQRQEEGLTEKLLMKVLSHLEEEAKSRPSPYGALALALQDKETYERFKELFGHKPDIEVLKLMQEMKKADRQFMLQLKKLEFDFNKELLKLRRERERDRLVSSGLRKVTRAVAEAVAEEEEEGGEGEAMAAPARAVARKKLQRVECECGEVLTVPPDAKEFECPACGAVYERRGKAEKGRG